jgi:RNA polymerase sigma factor (sigma-70 family)
MDKGVFISDSVDQLIAELSPYLSVCLNSLGSFKYRLEKDDLLQEIRLKIWQVYKISHENAQFNKTYIKKVIYSVLIDEINRARKEDRVLKSSERRLVQDLAKNESKQTGRETLRAFLLESIGELNKSKQLAIKLRLEGFSIIEIAGLNNWSYRKTCLILYRGIRELKRILQRRGIRREN